MDLSNRLKLSLDRSDHTSASSHGQRTPRFLETVVWLRGPTEDFSLSWILRGKPLSVKSFADNLEGPKVVTNEP